MTRFFVALAALATTATSLVAVHAATTAARAAAPHRVMTIGSDSHPILLKRMVVTATALPDA